MQPGNTSRLVASVLSSALAALALAGCTPPPPPPSPLFTPNPPYPPTPVDPANLAAPARPDSAPGSLSDIESPNPVSPPPPAPEPRSSTSFPGNYPLATPTTKPNRVVSPFPPFHEIDIEGFRSGQLARDPSNGKIFRVP